MLYQLSYVRVSPSSSQTGTRRQAHNPPPGTVNHPANHPANRPPEPATNRLRLDFAGRRLFLPRLR